jgi:hypothetical protein
MPDVNSAVQNDGQPDRIRQRLSEFQSRLDAIEIDARHRLRKALGASNEALHGLDDRLARMSREDWSMPGMRRRVEGLRARAENIRASAMKRVAEMPGEAMSKIATGSRVPVQNLARGIERIARRLDAREPPANEPERRG